MKVVGDYIKRNLDKENFPLPINGLTDVCRILICHWVELQMLVEFPFSKTILYSRDAQMDGSN